MHPTDEGQVWRHDCQAQFPRARRRAKAISDAEAAEAWKQRPVPIDGLAGKPIQSALKIYLAVKRDLEQDDTIRAAGINCLNESHFSDTTPCLAWNYLYEEKKIMWGC